MSGLVEHGNPPRSTATRGRDREPDTIPVRPSLLRRLGEWSARHRALTIAGWALVMVASALFAIVGIGGQSLFDRLENGAPDVAGEATQIDDLIDAAEDDDGRTVTLLVHGIDPLDPQLATRLDGLPTTLSDIETAHPGAALELSDPRAGIQAVRAGVELPPAESAAVREVTAADGNGLLVTVHVRTATAGDESQATARSAARDDVLTALDDVADAIRADDPQATVHVSSESRIASSYRAVAAADLERGEAIALPIALLVMVVVFGGFLAAGVPIVGALVSILLGFGSLFVISFGFGFDSMVINVVTLLGLGLSIDYGLLVISRFREELARVPVGDRDGLVTAVGSTVEHAGRTVLFSGTIFAASALGLLVFEPSIMRAIGIGTIAVVAVSVLVSISLLPALLATAGHRLARPGLLARAPGLRRVFGRLGTPPAEDGTFGRIARWAQRRPALVTLGALTVLGVIASPALAMVPVNDVSGALPRAATQYAFVEAIGEQFPDAAIAKVELVTHGIDGDAAARAAQDWADELSSQSGVASVGLTTDVADYTIVTIVPADGAATEVVERARAIAPDIVGVETWVTGTAAHDVDLIDSVLGSAPWAALVVVLLTFVLLFLMTGSVVMPVKSLLIAVISLGSAVGVLVQGFQEGHLAGPLRFVPTDVNGVDILVLTITLVLGFGLSMDYEVFLLGRVAELRDQGVPGREAVWRGMQATGRIITSAALIMIVVFLGFTVGDLLVIKQMGTALAVLVALDATLVRCVLVPAALTWGERVMWWSPRWLRPIASSLRIRH